MRGPECEKQKNCHTYCVKYTNDTVDCCVAGKDNQPY